MKNTFNFLMLLIIVGLLNSCFGLFDSGSDHITGNYDLIWIDLRESQGIAENDGIIIVPEYVFEVGYDDDFIFAKQHPTSGFKHGYEIDTSITNFYIIDMNLKYLQSKVLGPLSKDHFYDLVDRIGIEDLKFEMKYPEYYP